MVQNILGERDNKPTHAASLEHSKLIILTCTRCEWFNQLCFIDFHSTLGFVVSIRVWTKTKKTLENFCHFLHAKQLNFVSPCPDVAFAYFSFSHKEMMLASKCQTFLMGMP